MLVIPGKAFLGILLNLPFSARAQDNSYSLFPRHHSPTKSQEVLGMLFLVAECSRAHLHKPDYKIEDFFTAGLFT